MKKLIGPLMALIAFTMVSTGVSGCNNQCDRGIGFQKRLSQYEATITGVMFDISKLQHSCDDFRSWDSTLIEGSKFAKATSEKYFYAEDKSCAEYELVERCSGDRAGGGASCRYVQVCKRWKSTPRPKNGYEQGMRLSSLLDKLRADLSQACVQWEVGNKEAALSYLISAKIKLSAAQNDGEYVLQVAGCTQ